MEKTIQGFTLGEIARSLEGELAGPGDLLIERPVPAGSNDPRGITFAESERYIGIVGQSSVGAAVIGLSDSISPKPAIRVKVPREAFGRLLAMYERPLSLDEGIHPLAFIQTGAQIHETAAIGPFSVVQSGATIGARARVHPFCYIGPECHIDADVTIYPNVTLVQAVWVGKGSIIHSGAVLGADGFGFIWDGERQRKIPQVGGIRIGNNAEIGANTCIDRSTCGDTLIGDGTKIDNLVQIAHNVAIGDNGVIASQCGISGSVSIGDRLTMGGQAGVADHFKVCAEVSIAARAGVIQDIEESGAYFGYPALPLQQGLRLMALQKKLPELFERIKKLEDEIELLRKL